MFTDYMAQNILGLQHKGIHTHFQDLTGSSPKSGKSPGKGPLVIPGERTSATAGKAHIKGCLDPSAGPPNGTKPSNAWEKGKQNKNNL